MRTSSPFTRDRSPSFVDRKRSVSPQNYSSTTNRSHSSSIKSEHLWQSLEQVQLFPQEFCQLLKYEQRNINTFKKKIEREKNKVNQEFDALKRELIHNIEDLKLSVQAELDRIYKVFMQKYAVFKSEIVEIKRLRQEIETDLSMKSLSPNHQRFSTSSNNKLGAKGPMHPIQSNSQLVKSMQTGQSQFRKYHMINYIVELQKQKIFPLNDLCKELIILNEYDNGFFKAKEYNHLMNNLKQNFRDNLRYTYEKKFQFVRDPDYLVKKDEKPVLEGVFEEQPLIREVPRKQLPIYSQKAFVRDSGPVSNSQQTTNVQWCEELSLSYQGNLKAIEFSDIVLCGIEVKRNQIAVGGKDGSLVIYDPSTGNRIATLKGHKSSICSLAMINYQGRRLLASGSDHGCSSIILWDIDNWTPKLKLEGHKAAVTCILDLGDGVHIASGSYDKKINIYSLLEGKVAYNLPTNKSSVTGLILSARGTKMVSCGLDNSLNVWQIVRSKQNIIETMFLQRIIQNNTMICSFVGSMLQDSIMYIGTKDGKIKLINIQKGEAYKTLTCCNNAIIEMLIVERQSKPDHPIALCWPGKQECIKVVNCESGKVSNVSIKGYIEFGCGVGPKSFVLNTGRSFGMVSQSQQRKQISFFKLQPQG